MTPQEQVEAMARTEAESIVERWVTEFHVNPFRAKSVTNIHLVDLISTALSKLIAENERLKKANELYQQFEDENTLLVELRMVKSQLTATEAKLETLATSLEDVPRSKF